MLPGQNRQIPAMAMQPGYPMMPHEDLNNVPQPMIMMAAAPSGQQFAFAPAMYPMPQMYAFSPEYFNAMIGQQRFMPPPPYTMQMASTFRPMMRNDGQPPTEEQRRKMEKELKQRQFVEQQRRLQDLGSLGNVKVDPDKLIESIIRQSETRHKVAPPTKLPAATGNTHFRDVATTPNSASGEDVFGDFLSSSSSLSSNNEAQHPGTASSSLGTVAMTSSQLQQQSANDVDKSAVMSGTTAALSSSSILPGGGIAEKPKDSVKDLASMMMQCSDLSVPKEAKRFERKTAVNEVHVTKSASVVTYSESKAARHWDSSTDSLSELFTLPAQPTQPPQVFETNPSLPDNFKLPRWITGEAPIHDIYQQVLDAVTRDGLISTELVYPLLLRSGLPREALGYIWELCNRNTPGKLIREELFLILAMVSIAQNNMDYSSLAVLSKCPHAPVPNLGQFASPVADMHSMPVSDNPLVSGATSPLEHPSAVASPSFQLPAAVPLGGSGIDFIPSIAALPQMPYPVTAAAADSSVSSHPGPYMGPAALPGYGYASPGVVGAFPLSFPANTSPLSVVSYVNPSSSAVDDDFEDFQMAPISLPGLSQPQVISQVTVPAASHGDTELMKMDFVDPSDKYSVFRELSAVSDVPTESIPAPDNLLQPTSNSSTVISNSSLESDFTEFASFPNTSSSHIFSLPIVGSSDNFNTGLSMPVTAEKDEVLSTTLETKSELDSDSRYAALKSLVSSPSVFNTKPIVESWDKRVTDLTKNDVVSNGIGSSAENEDGGWAAFSSVGEEQVSDSTQQPASDTWRKEGGTSDRDGWAEFESASNAQDFVVDNTHAASSSSKVRVPLQASEASAQYKNEIKPKAGVTNPNKGENFFGQKSRDLRGPTTGLGISPLDFHPPELPDDEDSFDDFAMYPHLPKDGSHGGVGISSLSVHYLEEDDSCDALPEEKNLSAGKSASYFGMTQSNSSNSLEFTGWTFLSSAAAKEPDVQSASSLDLGRNKISDSRDQSPQQDGDSQSVSSLDFPPAELEQKSTADEQSVASLELKATSPESDTQSFVDSSSSSRIPDKAQLHPTDAPQAAAFNSNRSAQHHPVDLKELLEQGSLGRFGDRYSELMNEVQDSDRHAYEWERCLEMCYGILSEGSRIFGSLSSSSILNEILSTDEGSTYLKGLVEIYVVARRIEEEMKRVSISSSKLASQTKNITTEWNDIAAICAGNPVIPYSLDFTSCFLKADDYEVRRKACGVCLLNVDARSPASCLSGEVGSKALSYGGRQYHTTCANFWINCVSQTLPSLTIPELL